MDAPILSTTIAVATRAELFTPAEELALSGFLAGYSGLTREAYALVAQVGVGIDTAGALLVAAGENSERLRNERSFARLCGAAPLDASSGKQQRHRLSRAGDRQANAALWRIIITRLSYDPATRRYLQRRCAEGKTKPEAIRCLKRYLARELYRHLPREQLA